MKQLYLECCLYVCLCKYLLVPQRLGGFYSYSVTKSIFIIGQSPVNINILAQEIGALHMVPKEQIGVSFEKVSNDNILVIFQCFMETLSLNKTAYVVFSRT
jgi:hypothetical protein